MRTDSIKRLLDICSEAGHLEQLLPPLPKGITPRCVRVIEQVALLSEEKKDVRVSDISEMLDVTRPGITLVLRELAAMEYVTKTRDTADSRVVYVSLTEKGWALYHTAIEEYHQHLAKVLSDISDDDVRKVCEIIHHTMAVIARDTANRNAETFRQ